MIMWRCSKCKASGDGGGDALMAHYVAAHGDPTWRHIGMIISGLEKLGDALFHGETAEVVAEHEDARWARVLMRWEAKHV